MKEQEIRRMFKDRVLNEIRIEGEEVQNWWQYRKRYKETGKKILG